MYSDTSDYSTTTYTNTYYNNTSTYFFGSMYFIADPVRPTHKYIDQDKIRRIALNAEKSKWILREGPRMVFKPLNLIQVQNTLVQLKILRCNRRGIGLRINKWLKRRTKLV